MQLARTVAPPGDPSPPGYDPKSYGPGEGTFSGAVHRGQTSPTRPQVSPFFAGQPHQPPTRNVVRGKQRDSSERRARVYRHAPRVRDISPAFPPFPVALESRHGPGGFYQSRKDLLWLKPKDG